MLTSFAVQSDKVQQYKVHGKKSHNVTRRESEALDPQSFSCHISCVQTSKQLLLRLKETKEQSYN